MSREIFEEPDELPDALDWVEMATASVETVLRAMWDAEAAVSQAVDEIHLTVTQNDGTTFDPAFLRAPVAAYLQALTHYDEQQTFLDFWLEELEAARAERFEPSAGAALPLSPEVEAAEAVVEDEARDKASIPEGVAAASIPQLIETIDGLIAQLEAAKRGLRGEGSGRPD